MTSAAESSFPLTTEELPSILWVSESKSRDFADAQTIRCLPGRELTGLLDGLRCLADDGLTTFIVVTGGLNKPLKWYSRVFGKIPTTAVGEYVGPLAGNQACVVLCGEPHRGESDLRRRAEWYIRLLKTEGAKDVQLFHYPLTAPRESDFGSCSLPLYPEGGIEKLFARRTPIWKRAIDIGLSLFGLIGLAPLLLLTAVLIRLTSKGPVFFQQRRTGQGGRPFTIYKFRSMYYGSENRQQELRHLNQQDGPAFKILRDPRVTPLGRWLRKTCIDELPQLWNVLRGDMSLVGPRPLPCNESAACAGWQRRRLNVAPGITCLWQMRGRTLISFERWMEMDLEYISRQSLWFDLSIIAWTVFALIPIARWKDSD